MPIFLTHPYVICRQKFSNLNKRFIVICCKVWKFFPKFKIYYGRSFRVSIKLQRYFFEHTLVLQCCHFSSGCNTIFMKNFLTVTSGQDWGSFSNYWENVFKVWCFSGYHDNAFVATHTLGHMIYHYTLLVPVNQRVLNKLSKEHNINGHK